MISENQLPFPGNIHLKDEAKLAIIRDYLENHLSVEQVVSKYRLNNKYLFYQWVGQYVGKSLSLSESRETDLEMKKKESDLASCPIRRKT